MHHKHIIYGCIILIALSFICLTIRARQAQDADLQKNWWSLSFTQPDSEALDFTIENHSDTTMFTYEITQLNTETLTRTVEIQKGDSKEISVASSSEPAPQETTIAVWTDTHDRKELSK